MNESNLSQNEIDSLLQGDASSGDVNIDDMDLSSLTEGGQGGQANNPAPAANSASSVSDAVQKIFQLFTTTHANAIFSSIGKETKAQIKSSGLDSLINLKDKVAGKVVVYQIDYSSPQLMSAYHIFKAVDVMKIAETITGTPVPELDDNILTSVKEIFSKMVEDSNKKIDSTYQQTLNCNITSSMPNHARKYFDRQWNIYL